MKTWLYSEVAAKIKKDLDLEDEGSSQFIQDQELMDYCNEAIDDAEAEIHKLHEDYFLTSDNITLVSGQSDYGAPSDIYGHKIRGLVYVNGQKIYPIRRLRFSNQFTEIASILANSSGQDYQWLLVNASAAIGPKVRFVPTPAESGAYVRIWYIRNANRITANSNPLDIPEFINFIFQWMRVRCLEKEGTEKMLALAVAALQQQRKQMIDTLTQMIPDNDDTIEADFSHYREHI